LLKVIVKQFRKVMGRLREKPDVRLDDHEFEHLLLYHGLVGTSPDNQRSFKDVRADITDAIDNGSSLQLGIALKLQPLHWQDKIEKVLAEISDTKNEQLISVLLPDREGEPWPDTSDPLGHEDWRVRANAAFILGYLQAEEGLERMIKCLNDTAAGASPAYCHVANAIARIPGAQSKRALLAHIKSPEPWFRVDTAVALSNFSDSQVRETLMQSLLTINPLSDYLSVALSKTYPVIELLKDSQRLARKGGCQMLTGLTQAAMQTFTPEILQDTPLQACASELGSIDSKELDVFTLRAMLGLSTLWKEKAQSLELTDFSSMRDDVEKLDAILARPESASDINRVLEQYVRNGSATTEVELLNAVQLAGALKMASALPSLLSLLKLEVIAQEDIVTAIGTIGDATAAQPLIDLAQKLYKLEERTGPSLSAVPVVEQDTPKSKLYWRIIQSLGSLPGQATKKFLFDASSDFAPDKRQQILDSLNNLFESFSNDDKTLFAELVKSSLDDPAAMVKVSALRGVAALNAVQHLDKVLKMSDSQEPSISRQALATLGELAQSRNESVLKAITEKLNAETDEKRKRRLAEVIKGRR
jgi:HEAT repeat protein